MKLPSIEKKDRQLLSNTVMLYIMQFSTYLFSFITVPYLTRVLGVQLYGKIGVAVANMAYFQLLMDFGFLLSATEDISAHREDRAYVGKKLTSVALIKAAFAAVSFGVIFSLTCFAEPFKSYRTMYLLYIAAYIANSFLPDYFYRGVEKMTAITVRTVFVKLFSTVMTFVLLRSKSDYLIVPALLLASNLIAVGWAYFYLLKTLGFRFRRVTWADVRADLKRSSLFFLSRIAGTVYSATNTIITGYIDPTGPTAGYYTSADKIVSTAKSGLSPISDSVYPYMIKNKNFSLIKKILLVAEPVIIAGCVVVGVFARPLCVLAFGSEYAETAPILRAFLPVIAVILPSYLLGFPTLGAMGLSRYANHSIFIGTGVQLAGLALLWATGQLTAVHLAMLTSLTETVIMATRAFFVYRNRGLWKQPETAEE